MSNDHLPPRQEATILEWDEFTPSQQEAVRGIAGVLDRIANAEPGDEPGAKRSRPAFLPKLDKSRRNRVLLLDGERGSGKSTVMLWLLEQFSKTFDPPSPDNESRTCAAGGPPSLPQVVVPLGPIDLQPMDDGTHLLLHLMSAMLRVVEALEHDRVQGAPESLETARPWDEVAELVSRKAWRRFVKAAAAGWEGSLGRAASMGLEEYAVEVEYRERERLDIDRAFREFVDALLNEFKHPQHAIGPQSSWLFVLAIDDADMNPRKSAELLELVRTLWHPKVVFLLTGDSKLFLDLIEVQLLRDVGDVPLRDNQRGRLTKLAPQILDKVIPRPQRFRLDELPGDQRLAVLGTAFRRYAGEQTADAEEPSLTSILNVPHLSSQTDVLPGNLRRLSSLAQRLVSIDSPARRLGALLADAIDAAEEDDPRLEGLLGRITYTDSDGATLDLRRAQVALTLRADAQSPVLDRNLYDHDRARIVTGTVLDVSRVGEQETTRRYQAAMQLAWELFAETPPRILIIGPAPRLEAHWVTHRVPRQGNAPWPDDWDQPWTLPAWTTMRPYALAMAAWNRFKPQRVHSEHLGLDWLATCFLASVLAGEGREIDPHDPDDVSAWEHLATEVAALASGQASEAVNRQAPPSEPGRQWANQIAPLFAAPENGLSAEAANAWLGALQAAFQKYGLNFDKSAIAAARGTSANLGQTREQNYTYLDNQNKFDFIFADEMNMQGASSSMEDELKRALGSVRLSGPDAFTETIWANLASYFEVERGRSRQIDRGRNLARLGPGLQRKLATHLQAHGTRTGAQRPLYDLWTFICKNSQRAAEHINTLAFDQGDLLSPISALAPGKKGAPIVVPLASDCTLTLTALQPPSFEGIPPIEPQPLRRAMTAVLQVAFDVRVDEAEDRGIPYPADPYQCVKERAAIQGLDVWPGLEMSSRYGINLRLPTPQWATLVEWELEINAWAKAIERLRPPGDPANSFTHRNLEALVEWFIRAMDMSFPTRWLLDFSDLKTTQRTLNEAATTLAKPTAVFVNDPIFLKAYEHLPTEMRPKAKRGNEPYSILLARNPQRLHLRSLIYATWLQQIPAILAPEYNLSEEWVGQFLNTYQAPFESYVGILLEARRKTLRLCGVPEEELDGLMDQIDGDHSEHPWVKLTLDARRSLGSKP